MNQLPLMRFKVPEKWFMVKNSFFDLSPEIREGKMYPESIFVSDILSMEYKKNYYEEGVECDYVIDLGWYPDQDPEGQYRLVLLQENWDDILCTFESPDRFEIRDTLERWLDQVNRAPNRVKLEKRLNK